MKHTESKSMVLFSAVVALIVVMIVAPLIIEALNSFKVVVNM